MDTRMEINGKVVDLRNVFPLKIKMWKKLKTIGITPGNMQAKISDDVDLMGQMYHLLFSAVNPAITLEDIDEVDPGEIGKIMVFVMKEDVDRPT